LWVDAVAVTDPAFLGISNYNNTFTVHDLALVDLSSYGFTNDFLDVTDTKTNPANGTAFNCDADCHFNMTATFENTKNIWADVRYADANNYLEVQVGSDATLYVTEKIGGSGNSLGSSLAAFSDGVAFELDAVIEGSSIKVYVDKVLLVSGTHASNNTDSSGFIQHQLATNRANNPPLPSLGDRN